MSSTPDTREPTGGLSFDPIEWIRTTLRYIPAGDTIPDDEWRRRHRSILIATFLHVPFLILFGLYSGTEAITGATFPDTPLWVIAVGQGITVAVIALAYPDWLPRRIRTGLATTGLVATSITLVQYSGGFIEAHFHFFVVLGVLALYEDWLPFALGIGYTAFSHGVFGMINGSLVYNHAPAINNPWVWGLIHAIFVTGLAIALTNNWVSTEKSRETAQQRLQRAKEKEREIRELQEQRDEAEDREDRARAAKAQLEEIADEFSETMFEAADGDLTVRMEIDVESDAMAQIASAFNTMMDDTEATIREIQDFSTEVTAEGRAADEDGKEV